jgi:hypothetical protein
MKQHPKVRIVLIVAAVMISFVPTVISAEVQSTSSRVEVSFNHPEQFADIRDRYLASEENKKEVLSALQEYIVQRAPSFLPKGDALRITFDNIKLAGVINIAGVVGDRRVVLASTPPMFIVLQPENPAVQGRDEGLAVGVRCAWMYAFTLARVAPPVDETK